MKKVLLTLLIFAINTFSQDKDNPNVELPDFVITGKESFTLPKADKQIPPLISTVSDAYLKPIFPAEALEIKEFSDPLSAIPIVENQVSNETAALRFSMGSLYLPSAELYYGTNFWGINFTSFTDAKNRRAFTSNGEAFMIDQALKLNHIIPHSSEYFAGTEFYLNSNAAFNQYKMFGVNPVLKRNWSEIDFDLGFKNFASKSLSYKLYFKPQFFTLKGDTYLEPLTTPAAIFSEEFGSSALASGGQIIFSLSKLSLDLSGGYALHSNKYQNKSGKNNSLIYGAGGFNIPFSKILQLDFGMNYSKYDMNSFIGMTGKLSILVDEGLTLALGSNSSANLLTPSYFFTKNYYLEVPSAKYILIQRKNHIFMEFRYEFDKYFEIQLGGENYKSENMPYFNHNGNGRFTLQIDTATHSSAYVKLYFHKGPLGSLYFDGVYNSVTTGSGTSLPYLPKFDLTLQYANNFMNDWRGKLLFNFSSDYYLDNLNTAKESALIDVGFELEYLSGANLSYIFTAKNLLNQKRMEYQNYIQPGLNISLGLNYTW